jgi:hypothetical protein
MTSVMTRETILVCLMTRCRCQSVGERRRPATATHQLAVGGVGCYRGAAGPSLGPAL